MAGTNGKDKWLRVNRNDEIENPKFRGVIYQHIPATNIAAGTTTITADDWLHPNVIITAGVASPVNGPPTADLVSLISQRGLFQQAETLTLLLGNADPVNSKTINLGPDWIPSTFTLPPASNVEIQYKISSTNPPRFTIISVVPAGSTNPNVNNTVPPGNFGSDFNLVPSAPYDVIVRDVTNTMWVPSDSVNGGHLPFLIVRGTVISPTLDMVRIDDGTVTNGYNNFVDIRETLDQPNTVTNFHLVNGVSTATGFGNRGVGLTDTIFRSQITGATGAPNGYHARYGTQGTDVFYVRSTGVTKITLGAGPPVTNLAINAAGEICAAASSAAVKENIVNANTTNFIYNFVPREFNYVGDSVKQVGAVVEELQPLIPDPLKPAIIDYAINFAYTDSNGVYHPMTRDFTKPQSINNQGVIFCMLKELQVLKAAFDAYVAAHP